jgi:hypothetical protein
LIERRPEPPRACGREAGGGVRRRGRGKAPPGGRGSIETRTEVRVFAATGDPLAEDPLRLYELAGRAPVKKREAAHAK